MVVLYAFRILTRCTHRNMSALQTCLKPLKDISSSWVLTIKSYLFGSANGKLNIYLRNMTKSYPILSWIGINCFMVVVLKSSHPIGNPMLRRSWNTMMSALYIQRYVPMTPYLSSFQFGILVSTRALNLDV